MKKTVHIAALLALAASLLLLPSCKRGAAAPSGITRNFPEVTIPGMLDREQAEDYVLTHFWDAFLDTTHRYFCDSTHIAGVQDREVAAELATWLRLLQQTDPAKAAGLIGKFYDRLERGHRADTTSNIFPWMNDAVEYYLFDPNSDIRSEELYLPYISRLAFSDLAQQSKLQRYQRAVEVCSSNRIGSPAPDFIFLDENGGKHTLYVEKAPYTLLMFINPGCEACETAVDAFGSEGPASELVAAGVLRILDIYIDEDTELWYAKLGSHPKTWIHGHEPLGVILNDNLYFVRAIPSIYLLDSEKRIILKDATPAAVLNYLGTVVAAQNQ